MNLWRAEWMKTITRPFNQILFLIMVTLMVAFFVVAIIGALVAPDRMRPYAQQVLPYPQCLATIAQVAVIAGQLIVSVFVAHSVGSEYSGDTWKMILPRYGRRVAFLIAKMGVALVSMIVVVLTMLIVGLALSWIGTVLVGGSLASNGELPRTSELVLGVAVTLLPMLLYGSVALFVTIATRSALGGAVLTFFGVQTLALLSPFYGPLAIVMPYPHLPNIIERWVFRDADAVSYVTRDFGYSVSPLFSMGVVLAYCGGALLAASVLFHHRDMTSA